MKAWSRPEAGEMAAFYERYVGQCTGDDLFVAFEHATMERAKLGAQLTPDQASFRYAPGKWRIIDVLQHVIDSERVFAYRALRFARRDATELPGFEENDFAEAAARHERSLPDVLEEMQLVRRSTIALFRGFDEAWALQRGTANGNACTVRALGWIIAGHELHHVRVIQERYLSHAEAQHT